MTGWPLSYDVLIAGSGPAGLVLASACARRGMSVALVTRAQRRAAKPPVETLPSRGEFLLRSLGVHESCLAGAVASKQILVGWQSPSLESHRFSFDPHGRTWCIDRLSFDRALATTTLELGVEPLQVTSLSRLAIDRSGSTWTVAGGSAERPWCVRSDLLVDASGLARVIARSQGSVTIRHDLLAVIWAVLDSPEQHLPMLIEACPQGWWYSLGGPAGGLLCALVLDARAVAACEDAKASLWRYALQYAPHTRARIGDKNARLSVAVAESARLSEVCGSGWLAVGDAATSFDPLSSNGLCNAIEQSFDAAEIIGESASPMGVKRYGDGQIATFEHYLSQRARLYRSVSRFSREPFWRHRSMSHLTA